MNIDAMKAALEALERAAFDLPTTATDQKDAAYQAAASLRAAIEAAEKQEPVAWMYEHDGMVHNDANPPIFRLNKAAKFSEPWNEVPRYTAPVPQVPAGMKWQPIETAPKGECILIYQTKFKRVTMSINDGFEYKEATHWMPLPAAPKGE